MKGSEKRMRKPMLIATIVGGICITFGIGAYVGAATGSVEPGSVGDPVITKSYLDERLAEYKNGTESSSSSNVENEIAALKKQIEGLQTSNEEMKKQLSEQKKTTAQSNFKKVTIKSGKTLIMKYGTEMIFYSGQGNFKTANNKYILDLTERNHVSNNAEVLLYHTYLIRSGCNLEVTKDSVVYIQGTYTVK